MHDAKKNYGEIAIIQSFQYFPSQDIYEDPSVGLWAVITVALWGKF